eukprot:m.213557 g.213557  ORF g.213557 m.213557 type:complete len:1201 (+) comp39791_c0_seq19:142-3744(+)
MALLCEVIALFVLCLSASSSSRQTEDNSKIDQPILLPPRNLTNRAILSASIATSQFQQPVKVPTIVKCTVKVERPAQNETTVTIHWIKSERFLSARGKRIIILQKEATDNQTRRITSTLFIRNSRKQDSGVYHCTALMHNRKNELVAADGASVNVTIKGPPELTLARHTVKSLEGSPVNLTVSVRYNGICFITWTHSKEINGKLHRQILSSYRLAIAGETNINYFLPSISYQQAGHYILEVGDSTMQYIATATANVFVIQPPSAPRNFSCQIRDGKAWFTWNHPSKPKSSPMIEHREGYLLVVQDNSDKSIPNRKTATINGETTTFSLSLFSQGVFSYYNATLRSIGYQQKGEIANTTCYISKPFKYKKSTRAYVNANNLVYLKLERKEKEGKRRNKPLPVCLSSKIAARVACSEQLEVNLKQNAKELQVSEESSGYYFISAVGKAYPTHLAHLLLSNPAVVRSCKFPFQLGNSSSFNCSGYKKPKKLGRNTPNNNDNTPATQFLLPTFNETLDGGEMQSLATSSPSYHQTTTTRLQRATPLTGTDTVGILAMAGTAAIATESKLSFMMFSDVFRPAESTEKNATNTNFEGKKWTTSGVLLTAIGLSAVASFVVIILIFLKLKVKKRQRNAYNPEESSVTLELPNRLYKTDVDEKTQRTCDPVLSTKTYTSENLTEPKEFASETACTRESDVCSAPGGSFCCSDVDEAKEDVTVVGVLSSSNKVVLSVDHKNVVFLKTDTISKAIGPDGGNLSLPLSGIFVSVPAGALTTVEELTVSIFQPEGKESKSDPKLNLIEFLPHGITFNKDVNVRLPFNKENGSGSLLRLFHADGYNCTENYEPVALLETGETSCFLNEEKQMKFQIHDGYLLMQSSSFCRLCEYEEGDTPYNLAVSVFYRNRPVTGQEYCLDLTICLCCAHTKTQENMTDSMNKDNYKKCGFCTILCDSTFKQSLSVRVDPEQTGWKQKPSGEITFSSEKLTYSRNCSFRQFVTTNFMLTKSTVLTSFPHGSVTCSLYNISSNGSYKVDSAIIPLTSSPPGTRSISSSVSLQSSETQSGLSCGAQSLSRDGKTHDSPVLASLKENGSRIGFSLEKKSEFSKGFSDSSIYKCPSPKQLWKLAKLLGTEWKGVARSLNIPDADIKTICSSESDPKEQTMAMLHIWLNKEATSASIKALCIALREEDRTKDAVDVFEICEKLILGL